MRIRRLVDHVSIWASLLDSHESQKMIGVFCFTLLKGVVRNECNLVTSIYDSLVVVAFVAETHHSTLCVNHDFPQPCGANVGASRREWMAWGGGTESGRHVWQYVWPHPKGPLFGRHQSVNSFPPILLGRGFLSPGIMEVCLRPRSRSLVGLWSFSLFLVNVLQCVGKQVTWMMQTNIRGPSNPEIFKMYPT